MKIRDILKSIILIKSLSLLIVPTVLASIEIEIESIESIDYPSTIVMGVVATGGTITLNFEEYIKGVVKGEMYSNWDIKAYKAQAIAARTFALGKTPKDKHPDEVAKYKYYVCDTTCCQKWKPGPYNNSIPTAVEETKGIGITYNGSIIEYANFFSHAGDNLPEHYTRNVEDWTGYYHTYLRKTITPETDQPKDGGHSVGMSQYGAQELAATYGLTYQDILKHYYGPVPPYVKKVIVKQNNETKYEAEWIDNYDYPNPTRKLNTILNKPLNTESDATIEIHFSERVLTGVGASEIKVKIGNEEASYVSGSLVEGNNPPEKLKKRFTKEQLKNIGDGLHKIRIEAWHKYATEWQLDKDPTTFCYQEHSATNIKNYEEGIDENHKITIIIGIPGINITAGLVIDRSGSMDEGDKLPKAKEAAKYFVDASEAGDEIAISAFDHNPLLVAELTAITQTEPTNNPTKDSLKSAIDSLYPGGATNFGAGLSTAYNELIKSFKGQTTFCILMSDGHHNTGSYNNEVNNFKTKGWPIYTIGFGEDVTEPESPGDPTGEEQLKQIASTTGGYYYYAEAIPLVGIYHLITGKVKKESLLSAFLGFISYLQTITHLSLFDKALESAKFVLSWAGSDMDMVLIAPDGTEITPDTAATNPDIEYYKGNTYLYYIVKNPMPGEWKSKIIGTDLPAPERYTLTISGVSTLISNTPGFKSSYNLGETITVALSLEEVSATQTTPIIGADVLAEIFRPNNSTETLTLYDDGLHNDDKADDGLYANNYLNTNIDGFFQIVITASGTYSAGSFVRQLQETIQVGTVSAPPPVDLSPPTTPGTPTENLPDIDFSIGTYTIYWSPATDTESGIACYELQERINQGDWQSIGSTTFASYTLFNKPSGKTYYYRVRAQNGYGLWGSYSASSDGVKVVDKLEEIVPDQSYVITLEKIKIEIPSNTFGGTITFAITKLPVPSTNLNKANPKIYSILSEAVEFIAIDTNGSPVQPVNPLRITLPYNDPDFQDEQSDLGYRIYRLQELLNRWEIVSGNQTIDALQDTISVLLSNLSIYAVASPSFAAPSLADVYVYPNPCKGDNKIKFKNLTENVKIKIYTIAGQLIDEIEINNNPSGTAEWDTRNSEGKKVASGIYIYLITNDKGQKASGKISILR